MPRRGGVTKREVLPDPMYNSVVVTKLINLIMIGGKRGTAQKIVYDAFSQIAEKTGKDAVEVFEEAMNNIMPVLEVKARRVGGATYQVPTEVRPERRQALGIRWLVEFSRKRGERTMRDRLAAELLAASKGEGGAVKRREDVHRMAEANKAFAHYRW
jgi:small subunit ribosomal protein S7